jgi:hypothetical protein
LDDNDYETIILPAQELVNTRTDSLSSQSTAATRSGLNGSCGFGAFPNQFNEVNWRT